MRMSWPTLSDATKPSNVLYLLTRRVPCIEKHRLSSSCGKPSVLMLKKPQPSAGFHITDGLHLHIFYSQSQPDGGCPV